MMMPLALLGFLGMSLVPVVFVGTWILRPVNDARSRIGAPTRFMLTDFFWLMTLIQAALAFTTQFVSLKEPEVFMLVLGFLLFAVTAVWAGGVSFLSQAGVRRPHYRAAFQLVLLPGTMLVMIGVPFLSLMTLVYSLRQEIDWHKPFNAFTLGWVSIVGGSILLRIVSQWLVAGESWTPSRAPKTATLRAA